MSLSKGSLRGYYSNNSDFSIGCFQYPIENCLLNRYKLMKIGSRYLQSHRNTKCMSASQLHQNRQCMWIYSTLWTIWCLKFHYSSWLNQSKPALLLQTLFSFIIDLFMNLQKLMCEFISPAKKYNAPDCKHWTQPLRENYSNPFSKLPSQVQEKSDVYTSRQMNWLLKPWKC